jgi:hypothetical protein
MSLEYLEAVLRDPLADANPKPPGPPDAARVGNPQHVFRVSCARCDRIVEIQKVDAIGLAGAPAVWKVVGQRLLDDTCAHWAPNGTGTMSERADWRSWLG